MSKTLQDNIKNDLFFVFFSSITQVSLFLWTKAPSLRGNRLGALTDVDNVRANIVKINGKLKQTKKKTKKNQLCRPPLSTRRLQYLV